MSLLLCTEWLSHPQNSNSSIWWWKITRPAEDGTQRPAHDSTRLCCHHVTFPPEPRRSLRTYGAQRVVITEAWSLSLIAMTWYRSGFICLDIDLACKLKSFIYPTVHIGLSCVRNDTGLKWPTEMCFIVTDYKIYRIHQCKLTCFPNVSRPHLIYFMLFGMDDEVQRGIWGN